MAVKPKYVKDIGKEIYESYDENITGDFDLNKQIVKETTDIDSAEVRNRVAGYLCALHRSAKNKEEKSV